MKQLHHLHVRKWLNEHRPERVGEPGRPTLLLVYSPRCHGCIFSALPTLEALARGLEPGLLRLMALQVHETDDEQFHWQFDPTTASFPVALDSDMKTYHSLGAEGTPEWFVLSSEGQVVHRVLGSDMAAMTRLSYALEETLGVPVRLN